MATSLGSINPIEINGLEAVSQFPTPWVPETGKLPLRCVLNSRPPDLGHPVVGCTGSNSWAPRPFANVRSRGTVPVGLCCNQGLGPTGQSRSDCCRDSLAGFQR